MDTTVCNLARFNLSFYHERHLEIQGSWMRYTKEYCIGNGTRTTNIPSLQDLVSEIFNYSVENGGKDTLYSGLWPD